MGAALTAPADLAAWNRDLNRSHAMAGLRARGGWIVRAIDGRRRRLVARAVRRARPEVLADVGSEDGWIAQACAPHVPRIVLADVDGAVLERSVLAGRPGVSTVVCDALEPGPLARHLGARGADVLLLSALLEHLPEPGRALAALAPLLAPGGVFVVYVPADRPILFLKRVLKRSGLARLVRGLSVEPAPGHLHVFSRSSLARLLRAHGAVEHLAFDPLALGYVAVLRPRRTGD